MIQETFSFLLSCARDLLSLVKSTIVVNLTLPIHGHSYQLSLLDVAITFLIFDLAIVIVSVPIRKAFSSSSEVDE